MITFRIDIRRRALVFPKNRTILEQTTFQMLRIFISKMGFFKIDVKLYAMRTLSADKTFFRFVFIQIVLATHFFKLK